MLETLLFAPGHGATGRCAQGRDQRFPWQHLPHTLALPLLPGVSGPTGLPAGLPGAAWPGLSLPVHPKGDPTHLSPPSRGRGQRPHTSMGFGSALGI